MYSSGTWKDSDTQSGCQKLGRCVNNLHHLLVHKGTCMSSTTCGSCAATAAVTGCAPYSRPCSNYCNELAYDSFKMGSDTYEQMVALGAGECRSAMAAGKPGAGASALQSLHVLKLGLLLWRRPSPERSCSSPPICLLQTPPAPTPKAGACWCLRRNTRCPSPNSSS